MGDDKVSCHDLYSTYVSLPVFIKTRVRSRSGTAPGVNRQNAKMLRRAEIGSWALEAADSGGGASVDGATSSMWHV